MLGTGPGAATGRTDYPGLASRFGAVVLRTLVLRSTDSWVAVLIPVMGPVMRSHVPLQPHALQSSRAGLVEN